MNKIEAKISPDKISQVTTALAGIGIKGLTITDVKGLGREGELSGSGDGAYSIGVTAELAFELLVADHRTDEAVAAIVDGGKKLHVTVKSLDQTGADKGFVGVFRGQPCHFKGSSRHQVEMAVKLA
jgi:nitrogen regulatory protein P-II 1